MASRHKSKKMREDKKMIIDWLTITLKLNLKLSNVTLANDVANSILDILFIDRDINAMIPVKSSRFYNYAFVVGEGIKIELSKDMDQQGAKVTLSGTGCASQDAVRIIFKTLEMDWNITRIDIALDMKNPPVEIAQMWNALVETEGLKSHRQKQFIDGKSGQTVYIGSRKSDRFIRLYDKGAQVDMVGAVWHRLECEYKGDLVMPVLESICSNDGGVLFDILNALPELSVHKDVLKEMTGIDGKGEALSRSYKERDTARWWMGTIAPAFDKLCRLDRPSAEKMLDIFTNIMLSYLKDQED